MFSERSHQGIEVCVVRADGETYNEYQAGHTLPYRQETVTSTCWLDVEQDETFSIDIKLYPCVLINYHHGNYRFETRVDDVKIDDTIDYSDSRTVRHHHVSRSTAQEPGPLIFNVQAKFPTSQVISVDIEAGRMCRSMNKQNLDAVPLGNSVDQGMEAVRTASGDNPHICQPKTTNSCHWIPLEAQPYHRFVFKCQTGARRRLRNAIKTVKPVTPIERHPTPMIPDPRPVLKLGPVVPSPKPITPVQLKRKRFDEDMDDDDGNTDNDEGRLTNKEMYKAMLSMNRKIQSLERTVNEMKEQVKPKGLGVIDMTGIDSDTD